MTECESLPPQGHQGSGRKRRACCLWMFHGWKRGTASLERLHHYVSTQHLLSTYYVLGTDCELGADKTNGNHRTVWWGVKGRRTALVPTHNRTGKCNRNFKHIINRTSHGIVFFLCLFLRLCAWLRGTTEDLESWRDHVCYISTIKSEENISIHRVI